MKTYKESLNEIMPHNQVVFGTQTGLFINVLIGLARNFPEKKYYLPYGAPGFTAGCDLHILAKLYSEFDLPDNILVSELFGTLIMGYKQATLN